jgi:hypothetical protein
VKSLNICDHIVLVATVGLTGGGTTVDSKVSEIEAQLKQQAVVGFWLPKVRSHLLFINICSKGMVMLLWK